MIAAVLGIVIAAQPQAPTAGELLSTMFGRYHAAKTLSGSITLTQSAGQEAGKIETQVQYERPGKLFIKQQLRTASGTVWLVTADGKYFSYNKPRDVNSAETQGARLVEAIKGKDGTALDLGAIYAATTKSLGDRSTPLDIAIARKEDLNFLRQQWATIKVTGKIEFDGGSAWRIEGDWREYGEAAVTGKFSMVVTDGGDLRQFAIVEMLMVNGQQLQMVSRWDVSLKVDAAVNPSLFKVAI